VSKYLGHWIGVSLHQQGANLNGIGAWIEVEEADGKIMRREIQIGGGHASGHIGFWHFGLGKLSHTRVRVLWPDGTQGPWENVDADKFYQVDKGKQISQVAVSAQSCAIKPGGCAP
jgi:enediyne biosynthesis protein E4